MGWILNPALRPLPLGPRILMRLIWMLGQTPLRRPMMLRLLTGVTPPGAPSTGGDFWGYQPDAHDVIVSTYPKSGTNWMMQLCVQALHGGALDFEHLHQVVPWPDGPMLLRADLRDPRPPGTRRVIKTHLGAGELPLNDAARYVVVIRDPKDAFVSGYHFFRGVFGGLVDIDDITPEEWLASALHERFFLGCWAGHTASWWPERERDNVLVLRFEEMRADLPAVAARLFHFLGIELSEAGRDSALERSSFSWMKAHEALFQPPVPRLRDSGVRMIRSGKSGSRELLDDAQRARLDAHYAERLAALGSDFPYAELYGG